MRDEFFENGVEITNQGIHRRFNEDSYQFVKTICNSMCNDLIRVNEGKEGTEYKPTKNFTNF